MGTKLRMSSAYHPESDGQTEVTNRSLEQYLHCYASDKPTGWEKYLAWAEFWHNTSYHRAIRMSPFEAVYGRAPPIVVPYEIGSTMVNEVDVALRTRDELLRELKANLNLARQEQKVYADRRRRDEVFEEGDWVYLRLRPYRQHSVFKRAHQKLANRFFGPFQVIRRIGAVAYQLDLPVSSRIHPVFHVSLLRRWVGDSVPSPKPLPPMTDQGVPTISPERVLGNRTLLVQGRPQPQILIKWTSLEEDDATWEGVADVRQRFPGFELEGKFNRLGGADDENIRVELHTNADQRVQPRRSSRVRRPSWKLQG